MGFTTSATVVHELMEARDEGGLLNLQRQLSRLNLLIIDELGFVPLSRPGAELPFEVFIQRYERGSVLVSTNLPFDEWTEIFGSERLTGALLDVNAPVAQLPGGLDCTQGPSKAVGKKQIQAAADAPIHVKVRHWVL